MCACLWRPIKLGNRLFIALNLDATPAPGGVCKTIVKLTDNGHCFFRM